MSIQAARLPVWLGLALIEHSPLLALANHDDQIRYTSCVDRAPWRPGGSADTGNRHAPLARFAFRPLSGDLCVCTFDLLFSAPLALAWRLSEAMGARANYCIRRLGEWRLPCLFLVAGWATLALPRADRPDIAVAHLAWFALYGMAQANIIYFPTFYAEVAAIVGFYGVGVAIALVRRISKSVYVNGDVEFAKHAQLSTNYALASLGRVFVALARRDLRHGVQP